VAVRTGTGARRNFHARIVRRGKSGAEPSNGHATSGNGRPPKAGARINAYAARGAPNGTRAKLTKANGHAVVDAIETVDRLQVRVVVRLPLACRGAKRVAVNGSATKSNGDREQSQKRARRSGNSLPVVAAARRTRRKKQTGRDKLRRKPR
jgi:hypothetical protein